MHSHNFVDKYKGFVAFGFDRATDENTLMYYLQKFSDDTLLNVLIKKMADTELEEIFELVSKYLKKYLTEEEYHKLFLKDDNY
ncbi:MAG: cytoplasmic protein [Desulfobacterales bacterium]|nr:cytoplasmic protein [Desulfobacterales bacterium]